MRKPTFLSFFLSFLNRRFTDSKAVNISQASCGLSPPLSDYLTFRCLARPAPNLAGSAAGVVVLKVIAVGPVPLFGARITGVCLPA